MEATWRSRGGVGGCIVVQKPTWLCGRVYSGEEGDVVVWEGVRWAGGCNVVWEATWSDVGWCVAVWEARVQYRHR